MKILLFGLQIMLLVGFVTQVYWGITIARGERRLIRKHRSLGRRYFAFILLCVIIVEVLVHSNGGVQHKDTLFYTHITSALLFLLCLILLNWFLTGLNRRKVHKWIAYLSIVLFLLMEGTAIPIIMRL